MKYPLSPNSFSNDDIREAAKILFSKNITMGPVTKKFEKAFAKFIGAPPAEPIVWQSFQVRPATPSDAQPREPQDRRLKR